MIHIPGPNWKALTWREINSNHWLVTSQTQKVSKISDGYQQTPTPEVDRERAAYSLTK